MNQQKYSRALKKKILFSHFFNGRLICGKSDRFFISVTSGYTDCLETFFFSIRKHQDLNQLKVNKKNKWITNDITESFFYFSAFYLFYLAELIIFHYSLTYFLLMILINKIFFFLNTLIFLDFGIYYNSVTDDPALAYYMVYLVLYLFTFLKHPWNFRHPIDEF